MLAALGVPFDEWANQLATILRGVPTVIAHETTLTALGLVVGSSLMLVELWWKPVGRSITRVFDWRKRRAAASQLSETGDIAKLTDDHWADRRKMELMALANVASGRVPTAVPMSEEPENSRYHVLKEAVDDGRLNAQLTGLQADYGAIVTYEDFRRFAEGIDISWVKELRNRWAEKQSAEFDNLASSSPRISLVDLLSEAEKQDWRFTDDGSQHIFDFVRTFRDAGSTEAVQFWGREKQHTDAMTRDRPLEKITADYWKSFRIDGISLLKISLTDSMTSGLATDNFQTVTVADGNQTHRRLYADIHLDRESAVRWLATEGGKRRGEYIAQDHEFDGLDAPWYLQDKETELTFAIFLMVHRSDWGQARYQNLVQPDSRDVLIEAMTEAAQQVRRAAMNGELIIRGRRQNSVEFERISADTWKLVVFNIVEDGHGSLKVVPTANDGINERISHVLDYEVLEVNSREFEALWPERN